MLGALLGGGIGAVFGNPFALVGALVGGTAASLNADEIWDGWEGASNRVGNRTMNVIDTFSFRYNDANIYDFVGDYHNEGLVYLHQAELAEGGTLTPTQQYNYLNTFVTSQYPDVVNGQSISETEFNTVVYQTPALDYLKSVEEVNEANKIELVNNIQAISYLPQFQKDFFVILINYGVQFNEETYYLAEYFYGIENLIITSSLNESEKSALLSALATGRASANFWWDVEMGNR